MKTAPVLRDAFVDRPRPLLFAHRGASRYAPENTLAAFDLAARLGADVLELDVHLSKDGEVVVIHDPEVSRTTNGHGAVSGKTYSELAALDAGFRFLTKGSAPDFRGRGCHIPRLSDVLSAFPALGFNIELKQHRPPMVRAVLDLLERVGAHDVLLAARDHRIMAELEAARPGCGLGLSRRQVIRLVRGTYFGDPPPEYSGRAAQIPPRCKRLLPLATGPLLRTAKASGIEVHLWTINSMNRAAKWLVRGVDGIMSDDPGALFNLICECRLARRTGASDNKESPCEQQV